MEERIPKNGRKRWASPVETALGAPHPTWTSACLPQACLYCDFHKANPCSWPQKTKWQTRLFKLQSCLNAAWSLPSLPRWGVAGTYLGQHRFQVLSPSTPLSSSVSLSSSWWSQPSSRWSSWFHVTCIYYPLSSFRAFHPTHSPFSSLCSFTSPHLHIHVKQTLASEMREDLW